MCDEKNSLQIVSASSPKIKNWEGKSVFCNLKARVHNQFCFGILCQNYWLNSIGNDLKYGTACFKREACFTDDCSM